MQTSMNGYEPLDARIEYTVWYDNGQDDQGVAEFNNREEVDQFSAHNRVIRTELFIGNKE